MPDPVSDAQLLERHRPQLRYHPNEPYRADSAATMTDAFTPGRHSNELRDGKTGRVLAKARPTAGTAQLSLSLLVPHGKEYVPGGATADGDDHLVAHGSTLRDDWLAARALPGRADVVYGTVRPGKDRRWLQYWFFFYDNPYKRFGFGEHQGDWEMIQIAVVPDPDRPGDCKPVAATYAQHGKPEARDWKDVRTVDGAGVVPVVWIAKKSHASYYAADEHFRILGIANDHTADGGVTVRPRLHVLGEADAWIHWPGHWGATGGGDDSPLGPPHQKPWKDPEGFHAAKRRGGLLAGLEAPRPPMAPTVVARLEQDALVVTFALPDRRPPGRSDPVRIELAVHGSDPGVPPGVAVADITELRGEVRVPLPAAAAGALVLHAAVYDSEDTETRLEPLPIAAPPQAGLAGPRRRVAPQRSGPAPIRPTDVRLVVRTSAGGEADRARLEEAVAAARLGAGDWAVAPLFRSGDDELARYLTVSGAAPAAGLDVAAAAFEAARALEPHLPAGWEVEPDVPSSAPAPRPRPQQAALSGGDRRLRGWALEETRCREAWALPPRPGGTSRGEGIVIGQPDTGYTDHPELELDALDRLRDHDVLTGRDDAHAVLRGIPPLHFPSHGTGTASVAVSREPGEITGSAPAARLVPIRAAETVIHVRNAELALAVQRAWELGCDVITISMGGILYPRSLRAIIARAVADGVIVMAAAGQFVRLVVWPARFPECLAIGGSSRGLEPWEFSSVGREVDVSAPAEDVWVAVTRNDGPKPFDIAAHDGTSFAVATAAGIAALWLAHHGGRDAVAAAVGGPANVQAAFRALVRRTATVPGGWDTRRRGAGVVNAEALLQADLASWDGDDPPPPSPAPGAETLLDAAAALAPPEVEPADAQARVRALLPDDAVTLGRFGDEVLFRLAEHEPLRNAVFARPSAGLERGPAARTLLRALASPSLRDALG